MGVCFLNSASAESASRKIFEFVRISFSKMLESILTAYCRVWRQKRIHSVAIRRGFCIWKCLRREAVRLGCKRNVRCRRMESQALCLSLRVINSMPEPLGRPIKGALCQRHSKTGGEPCPQGRATHYGSRKAGVFKRGSSAEYAGFHFARRGLQAPCTRGDSIAGPSIFSHRPMLLTTSAHPAERATACLPETPAGRSPVSRRPVRRKTAGRFAC